MKASHAHIRYVTFWFFRNKIEKNDIKCDGVRKIMKSLCMLYGLFTLHSDCHGCFESGYFTQGSNSSELMLAAIKLINQGIRP